MKTFIPEFFKSQVLLPPQTTAVGAGKYASPTAGVNAITVRAIVTMGNAADLALSLKYADDANGTNATDFPEDVPVFVDGVREDADAKAHTIGDATGNFIVDFCIDPGLVPEGKFIGLAYGNSNAANLVATEMIEEI